MSPSGIAVVVIFGIVLLASALGFYAGARRKMDLEQWTVAGRSFGLIFMWLLMAGEIYTAFTFLGASGWAYSHGGATLYVLAYGTLGYVVSFFILPPIWDLGRKFELQTQPDFFGARYESKFLAGFVSESRSSSHTSNCNSPDSGSSCRWRVLTGSVALRR